jgi:hypothetical protein
MLNHRSAVCDGCARCSRHFRAPTVRAPMRSPVRLPSTVAPMPAGAPIAAAKIKRTVLAKAPRFEGVAEAIAGGTGPPRNRIVDRLAVKRSAKPASVSFPRVVGGIQTPIGTSLLLAALSSRCSCQSVQERTGSAQPVNLDHCHIPWSRCVIALSNETRSM